MSLPILLAPCGGHNKAHPKGEVATYRAAAASGIILAVSANASTFFEELARAATGHLWLQMYPFRDITAHRHDFTKIVQIVGSDPGGTTGSDACGAAPHGSRLS